MNQLLLSKTSLHDDVCRRKIDDNVAVLTIKPIEFHASSFFKLDLSIVTGIIAAITTYLIVVIQFKLSEEQVVESPRQASFARRAGDSSIPDTLQIVQPMPVQYS